MEKNKATQLLDQYRFDRNIFHDLIQFRVRDILLVSTLYDAYVLEREGQLSEQIFGEYYQLNLTTAPRITHVLSGKDALKKLKNHHFTMVILMMQLPEMSPFELSAKIKSIHPKMPVLLLLKDNSELLYISTRKTQLQYIDKVFVWNGDPMIFVAMIKYIEDKRNVRKDTRTAMVRVILLVEDSIRYYSRYLPVLYTEIIRQTQKLLAEEHYDEMEKILRMRVRPKVLMAENYDQAVKLIDEYKSYLLCAIADAKFPVRGKLDPQAGIKLIKYVKQKIHDLPTLLQSSDTSIERLAWELHSGFLNKNSESLSGDLTNFIFTHLGFGDFVFKDSLGREIARADSMEKFKKLLEVIPDDSLKYHASSNHFSAWLMARGEIRIAKLIQPLKVSDFSNPSDMRAFLINVCKEVQFERKKGKIVHYDESVIGEEGYILQLSPGSLGGKGRGIAFLNSLLQNFALPEDLPEGIIKIPPTAIIGTEEFDHFITHPEIQKCTICEYSQTEIKRCFLNSKLSPGLRNKLRQFLERSPYPLAVRSSGLFEDSISQPFSGVYPTFLLPNNQKQLKDRLQHLMNAIKLIYASVYSKPARLYLDAINYSLEEEKMAIIIQEVVGNQFGNKYYPHFSGVAQSYNFYPFSYIKPEDGNTTVAVGLGTYIAEGGKAFRFCPKYPKIEMAPPEKQLEQSQQVFYSINMANPNAELMDGEDITLLESPIMEAEKDGTLSHMASVWDYENGRIKAGLHGPGPRIINFSHIIKYNYFPLAQILEYSLNLIQTSMGTPVEIEFAVDLTPGAHAFYLLQIKHLMGDVDSCRIDVENIRKEDLLLYTERGMGNGKITDVYDIIYVDPKLFDKSATLEIVEELETLNKMMISLDRKYILIGSGRWGTRDRWLGIPVNWAQISNVRVIVEINLDNFRIEPSLGSHFFHTITSMRLGYFAIPYESETHFIDWNWLKKQEISNKTRHCIHVHMDNPVTIIMDGRTSVSVIYKPSRHGTETIGS